METKFKPKKRESNLLDFGDTCLIEQKRHVNENEMFVYKVIGRLHSNSWVDIPVQSPAKEVLHKEIETVLRCICCGVSEDRVLKFRESDVKVNDKFNI